jgi:hypothetical protein
LVAGRPEEKRRRGEVQGQISRKVGREINSFRASKKRDIPRHLICKKFSQDPDADPDPADAIPVLKLTLHHITSLGVGAGAGMGAGMGEQGSRRAGEQESRRTGERYE